MHVLLLAGLRVLLSGVAAARRRRRPERAPWRPRRRARRASGPRPSAAGDPLDRLFDATGTAPSAGAAVLLPPGPTTPEIVREVAAAGARAVLVDGPVPAGSLGMDEPVEVPILGVDAAVADEVRTTLAADVPVELSVGAASTGPNDGRGAPAPFSSEGLGLSGGAKPELTAPGVGLATSEPGRTRTAPRRYGTLSGIERRRAARRGGGGAARRRATRSRCRRTAGSPGRRHSSAVCPRPAPESARSILQASSSVELVADLPAVAIEALGPARSTGAGTSPSATSRAARWPSGSSPSSAQPGVTVALSRTALSLPAGASKVVKLTVVAGTLPDPPSALTGALRVGRPSGSDAPGAVDDRRAGDDSPVVSAASLSEPDVRTRRRRAGRPHRRRGRVDGTAERPQLLPVETLEVDLFRGARKHGAARRAARRAAGPVRVRHHGPGAGRRRAARPARTRCASSATPVGGGEPTLVDIPFRVP